MINGRLGVGEGRGGHRDAGAMMLWIGALMYELELGWIFLVSI